jgi:hypothetical protein
MSIRRMPAVQVVLIGITVVGLGIDAYVHFDLAPAFARVRTSTLSQADLFRVEASAAIVAALALLLRPRRYTAAFAFLVAAAGTVAVVLYRYVDVGAFGPVPDMYDPYWQPVGKWLSLVGEVAATICAAALVVLFHRQVGASQPGRAESSSGLDGRTVGNPAGS